MESVIATETSNNYKKYRGKCKEYCDKLIRTNIKLKLVRGYYICPFWGEQQHWWCINEKNIIIDPTKEQFPSCGAGEYIEFDGFIQCETCEKKVEESQAYFVGRHAYCSYTCYGVAIM